MNYPAHNTETASSSFYDNASPQSAPSGPNTPLSLEEQVIMKECQQEAFYNRGLPLALIMGGSIFMGIKNGRISSGGPVGLWLKPFVAGSIGMLAGYGSYSGVCSEKFLKKAPQTNMARRIRESRGFPDTTPNEMEILHRDRMMKDKNLGYENDRQFLSSDNSLSETNESNPGQTHSGFESSEATTGKPMEKRGLSYDDLRQRHRDAEMRKYFQGQRVAQHATRPNMETHPPSGPSNQEIPPLYLPSRPKQDPRRRINQYGDDVYSEA
ncbi:hypothetical protein TCAL_00761 [Tigriopus californicus]|uniref:OCIA domain-containing protein n=1 Tax=Tigriopus californicus TaxID=6832 RepID=A0A553PCG3_TIGCA|nr:OCIA domain-containing protein 1-like [Tigriopus californicus]TRY75364.1 hypothetical protein TCAL_00761 [Tigriopus californicus]|eukprot:TCALIF_00761-PA protein Name:"Similar to GA12348 OCIA domain-containing protein 1 (Drosophila pseudoobscura pseudoobscura)" AED:0.34 eAED:0.34 QI:0/-1/0/1/-1/1/1/0/267